MKFSKEFSEIGRYTRERFFTTPSEKTINEDDYPVSFAQKKKPRWFFVVGIIIILFIAVSTFIAYIILPPRHFPVGVVLRIEEGWSLRDTAEYLKLQKAIHSKTAYILATRYLSGGDEVIAGDYYFPHKQPVTAVAEQISQGDFGLTPLAVFIPEGATVDEIGSIFERTLSDFNKKEFTRLARPLEGYLFPDTYHFLPTVRPRDAIKEMRKNFERKVAELQSEIEASGKDIEDIVIMASIIEKEAEDDDTARRKISGVLWKRLEINMPLQVDVSFVYFMGKGSFELTRNDLEVDSPYNTYKYEGLPPGPISNPGLASLRAALNPIETDYLFYLADMSGKTHFARNYEEHKWNIRRYLD